MSVNEMVTIRESISSISARVSLVNTGTGSSKPGLTMERLTMVKITYLEHGGARHDLDGRAGSSVMETAVHNSIPGIDADCGGACACATCHVYVDPTWLAQTGARTTMEESMLEFAEGVEANSRLACQIRLTAELDGLVVRLPESQH